MTWFFTKKITITGADAQEAHAIMHELGINHHAFANFNGLNFKDGGEFGLMDTGSNEVTIPLHGQDARDARAVVAKLQQRNPKWKFRIIGKTVQTGKMTLVPAPSIWGVTGRLLKRLADRRPQ